MKRLRLDSSDVRTALVQALPGSSPEAKAHLDLLKWAASVLRGHRFASWRAIDAALYDAQRKIRVPNSAFVLVIRDLSKEIFAVCEDVRRAA